MERKLVSAEVIFLVGVSYKTFEIWYRFKRENPEHELSKMLPDYEQEAARKPRYWKESDIEKLIAFKDAVPHGRNGLFGSITHQNKYRKAQKEREKNHGKKENSRRGKRSKV